MQKAGTKLDNPNENVRDSWEELDDLITIPEPVPKSATSSKKKESPKQVNPSTVSAEPPKTLPMALSSNSSTSQSEPEIGRVRILKRNPNPGVPTSGQTTSTAATPVAKTYEERVRNYNEARMRILGSIDDEVQSQLTGADGQLLASESDPVTYSPS